MEPRNTSTWAGKRLRYGILAICAALLLGPGAGPLFAQETKQPATPAAKPETAAKPEAAAKPAAAAKADTAAVKLPPEQLESLVAPLALYPDALLAQALVASTYPLELVQLHQWLAKHKDLKDKALADSVAKQPWDPSIQSMAAVPEVVDRLAKDIQWTTDLGNAFLAQQSDVMDAVQRMRKKAQDKGALASNEQQVVETKVIEEKTVIVVESADPEVIYVPSYDPVVVYGAGYYPYPPIYYPPYPAGAAFVSFGVGMMWGAAMWGGSCCGCGWGGNNVNINVDNNFNRIDHHGGGRGEGGRGGGRGEGGRGGGQGGNWKHNPQHRGAAPYGDRATANKFGGSARGDSPANRAGGAGVSNRASGGAGAGAANRSRTGSGAGSAGVSNRSRTGSGSGASAANRGGDKVGNRNISKSSKSSGSRSGGGFSGGSKGYSRSGAQSSRSRGSSSMGGRSGGGSRGGGGGRGGGGRR